VPRATTDDDRLDLAYALRAAVLPATRQRRWDDAIQTLDKALLRLGAKKDVERVRAAIAELDRA
jgi:hypothetical protein